MSISNMPSFTYLQQRLLDVLNDGERHTLSELCNVIDEYASVETLRVHICTLRKLLGKIGHDIVCEQRYNRTTYRRVMLIYRIGGQPPLDISNGSNPS